jgi:predicted dehydrogenase
MPGEGHGTQPGVCHAMLQYTATVCRTSLMKGSESMNRTAIRAGLVGCGSLAQRGVLPHLAQPDARERLVLTAVVDADGERARRTAEAYQVPHWFTSIEAMLAGCDVDIVLVLTPIPLHYAHAAAAIAAGKHVYVQKAMTASLADADALLAARDRAGVRLVAAPGYELFPATGAIRAEIAAGAIGHAAVTYTYTMGFGHEHEGIRQGEGALQAIDPSWYYRQGAGPLPDVTVYALQLVTSVLGPVRRVTALANQLMPLRRWRDREIAIEVADNQVVLMEHHSGALSVAVGSDCRGAARVPWGAATFFGTDGCLDVTEVDGASGYPTRYRVAGREVAFALDAQPYLRDAHLTIEEPHVYADIMELVDAVEQQRAPRASGEHARHVVELIAAAHRAADTGTTQTLTTAFEPGT